MIAAWLERNSIIYYKINDDLTVDIPGNVWLQDLQLKEFPFQFNVVGGNFSCSNNKLTSLLGAPRTVGGNFHCDNNQLTNLEGGPKFVGGSFSCQNNKLTSLQGAPKIISSNFFCHNNSLLNLDYLPNIEQFLYCENNPKLGELQSVRDPQTLTSILEKRQLESIPTAKTAKSTKL